MQILSPEHLTEMPPSLLSSLSPGGSLLSLGAPITFTPGAQPLGDQRVLLQVWGPQGAGHNSCLSESEHFPCTASRLAKGREAE